MEGVRKELAGNVGVGMNAPWGGSIMSQGPELSEDLSRNQKDLGTISAKCKKEKSRDVAGELDKGPRLCRPCHLL